MSKKKLVTDELWEIIEPLLPPEAPRPKGGRPRVPDRAALTGIVFVLKSGIPWEMLPQEEMGCGSGSTCSLATLTRLAAGGRGVSCTGCSWIGWAKPTRSTGSALLWTRQAWLLKGGPKNRPEPDG